MGTVSLKSQAALMPFALLSYDFDMVFSKANSKRTTYQPTRAVPTQARYGLGISMEKNRQKTIYGYSFKIIYFHDVAVILINNLLILNPQVEAIDIDEGENARISYSIYHVSNNGGNKFTIDPNTGVICKLHLFLHQFVRQR